MPSVILQGVLSRLRQVRRSGEGYVALCPSHDDQKHSLSIGDGDRGIVLNCHAGCTPEDVARAMDLELKNLFFEGATSHSVVAEYEYRDENNALV